MIISYFAGEAFKKILLYYDFNENRIMLFGHHLFSFFSLARSALDMTPCVCVYAPPAYLVGMPRAAFLALVCGRVDGTCIILTYTVELCSHIVDLYNQAKPFFMDPTSLTCKIRTTGPTSI